jgi:hypothetical protein
MDSDFLPSSSLFVSAFIPHFGTSAIIWPIVPAPDDEWLMMMMKMIVEN